MGESKKKFVDPRFNDLCGEFRSEIFNTAYSFVDEYKKEELGLMKKRLHEETSDEVKESLQQAIRQRSQDLNNREYELQAKKKVNQARKQEAEAVRKGKAPFYMKKCKLFCWCF
jgi:ribosomal RNA-processing protein 36